MGEPPMPRYIAFPLTPMSCDFYFPEVFIRYRLSGGERDCEIMPRLWRRAAVVQGQHLGGSQRAVVDAQAGYRSCGGLVVGVSVIAQEPRGAGECSGGAGINECELLDAIDIARHDLRTGVAREDQIEEGVGEYGNGRARAEAVEDQMPIEIVKPGIRAEVLEVDQLFIS